MPALPPLRLHRRLAALVLAASVLLATSAAADLTVGAAVSLREPVSRIAALHERSTGERVRLVFGASSALAAQIRAGAPLDLLLSADAEIADASFQRGEVELPVVFAGNRLVVVVAQDLETPIATAADLTHAALRRIAIPDRAVPVGRYAHAWLERQALLDRLRPRIVHTEHARATLAAVDQGNVQAAVVYRTDARLARHARVAFEIAPSEHPPIRYAAAVVRGRQTRAARAFLAQMGSSEWRAALEQAGFVPLADMP